MTAKRRADQLLVEQGLAESRAKAQALILAGLVWSDGRRIDKAGAPLAAEAAIEVKGRDHPWVSRGGVKLAHALDYFAVDVAGKTALDIGASTGGFTDVLLSRGARRVYAVDVGHGQLAWKLRQDPRVVVREKANARYLTRTEIPEPIEIITCDASFIGLATILPAPLALAADRAALVALIKPQFEAGRAHVGKGGVVGDPAVRRAVCERVSDWVGAQPGWTRHRHRREPDPRPRRQQRVPALRPPRRRERPVSDEPFAGFPRAAFAFFEALREHNDPAWFKPRKAVYETAVLAPFRQLLAAVGSRLRDGGMPLVADPARGIFRIYRDVRFSSDKRPYKTHAGAVLTRTGRRGDPGVLYIHLAPGKSMAAAGFWHPAPNLLARLRRAIFADPQAFLAIAARLAAAGSPLTSDAQLARLPRGFEDAKGSAGVKYMAWKSFTAHAALSDAEMQSAALVDRIVDFAHTALPLLQWGWDAADAEAPEVAIPPLRHPLPKPDF